MRTGARPVASEQLRALARLARAHGSGVIELTRRANLQLRGLRFDAIAELREELIARGLADALAAREGRPGLLVDPLAEVDACCASGVAELARAVDEALAASAGAHTLSSKLGVAIDGGSGCLSGIDADLRIAVRGEGSRAWLFAGTYAGAELVGSCARADVPAVVTALLAALAEFAPEGAGAPRMRDLVRARGLDALRACSAALSPAAAPALLPEVAPARAALGHHAGRCPWFGLGVPFGSAPYAIWLASADLAERFGRGELRLTPAREVVIPGVPPHAARELSAAARALGLITAEADPRRRVVACSGAPACSAAYGETRALAVSLGAQLQPLLAAGATLHVSGCAKGCASSEAAQLCVVLAEGGARFATNAGVAAASAAPVEPLATVQVRLAALCAKPAAQAEWR